MTTDRELHTRAMDRLALHARLYGHSARLQHEQAVALLAQDPPDFSAAATACHRALQFERQQQALDATRKELEL